MTSRRKIEELSAEERLTEAVTVQRKLCERYGAPFVSSPGHLKVGLARNIRTSGLKPLNGLRHPPQGDTTGWYIWAGEEFGTSEDFFQPLHVIHLVDECPMALKFLGLAPGLRFLVADHHEDVWQDPILLKV